MISDMTRSSVPTLEDVAKRARVSRATVSRAINTPDLVSKPVLKRTRAAIAELRYVPNRAARALTGTKTDMVGLMFFEDFRSLYENPFWGELINDLYIEFAKSSLNCWFIARPSTEFRTQQSDEGFSSYAVENYLLSGYVDGLIFLGQGHRGELEATLGAEHVPIVMFGRPQVENPTISYVAPDNVGGARLAVEYLACKKQRKHIATITGLSSTLVAADRLEGYKLGLKACGRRFSKALVAEGDFSRAGGARAMNVLLDRGLPIDAVFVANDLMAAGALDAIQARGLRVPQDIAVMGFDNSPLAETTSPKLTSINQPFDQMAHELVAGIERAIKGEVHQSVVFGVDVMERESA